MLSMTRRYGKRTDRRPGFLRRVHFPQLALLDEWTGDGRKLDGETGSTRSLPRTIFFQFSQSYGHQGSVPVGVLQEVTFNEEGVLEGSGWLVDTEEGRKAALLIATQAQYHNSIDITEAHVQIEYDEEEGFRLTFNDWKLGATTFVGKPAFADAHGILDDDDEVTAVLAGISDEDLVMPAPAYTSIHFEPENEVTADASIRQPYASFHRPEPDRPTSMHVTPEGDVYFHLGEWNKPHMGIDGVDVFIPRPPDNYASFNCSGVPTDKGRVETGPIFLLGGHPDKPLGDRNPAAAYGGIENAWADVRITEGRFGPWACGRVRPGVSPEAAYAAHASRYSGHWKGDHLLAVVSVNVGGYQVSGSGLSLSESGAVVEEGKVLELVASFAPTITEDGLERPVYERTEVHETGVPEIDSPAAANDRFTAEEHARAEALFADADEAECRARLRAMNGGTEVDGFDFEVVERSLLYEHAVERLAELTLDSIPTLASDDQFVEALAARLSVEVGGELPLSSDADEDSPNRSDTTPEA